MLERIIKWIFGNAENNAEASSVVVHDFTDRQPGHDIALHYYPSEAHADAVVFSQNTIEVGQLINLRDQGILFSIDSVKNLAPMAYQVELSVVSVDEDED